MTQDRIALYRPLTQELLHPEVTYWDGDGAPALSAAGSIQFTVSPDMLNVQDEQGDPILAERKTLVVVVRPNGEIRSVGIVDDLDAQPGGVVVSAGGPSMIIGQSGPWEGHQGYYVNMDALTLFRRVVSQVQEYPDSNLGMRVVGDMTAGTSVGTEGSARYQRARRDYNRYLGDLEKWEGRLLTRERILSQREEAMFRAAGLKRVGRVTVTDQEPDDPGYEADSTLWIRESDGRALRWRNGRWISQSQADDAVRRWQSYTGTRDRGKAEVDRLNYLMAPAKELMDEYEKLQEGREEYSLYFWQNHDLATVVDHLMEIGPFQYREEAVWDGERIDIRLRTGSPTVGVRRHDIHLELGTNIEDIPVAATIGEIYTGVTVFGAGEGSEMLSEQRTLRVKHAVRNILVDSDTELINKTLVRQAANELVEQVDREAAVGFSGFTIIHDEACPEGSFDVGDEIYVAGTLTGGKPMDRWVRVVEASHKFGSNRTRVEVEPV